MPRYVYHLPMKFLILNTLFFCLLLPIGHAQISISQSSPDTTWKKIENTYFEVIFPDTNEDQGQYIFNLLNHYREIVNETYKPNQKKLSLVLRSELAMPNGFVTLAPRRTEWFMNKAYTPFVGSLDWFQSLAIHEYRHVVQFDFLNRSNNRLARFMYGENILGLVLGISIPNWFYEGDAVWAETMYSNAGRGRSPRFAARMKALLVANAAPSFDQLLAGDHTNSYPNLYVYGYFLISKGVHDYGDKFWAKVAARASDTPLYPYALYQAFEDISGKSIDVFYNDLIDELKVKWSIKLDDDKSVNPSRNEYITKYYPIFDGDDLYYLEKSLTSFWKLKKKDLNGREVELTELNIIPSLSRVDIKNKKFIYTQYLPHFRYAFKGSSDLFIYDEQINEHKKITNGERYYHPKFNQTGDQFLAIRFTLKNQWVIDIFNTKSGEVIKTIHDLPDFKIMEAVFGDKNNLYAIALAANGMKKIIDIDLETNRLTNLTQITRNNIFSLHFEEKLFFEADDLGSVNIFAMDIDTKTFTSCTQESIMAQNPHRYKDQLYYVKTDSRGTHITNKTLDCSSIYDEYLFDIEQYIGETPSDNYHQGKPVTIKNYAALLDTKSKVVDYPEYSKSLTPHSWSFYAGRGYQVSANTNNTLGTLGMSLSNGISSEEQMPYLSFQLDYAKYYPIFQFGLSHLGRRTQIKGSTTEWDERSLNLAMTLPYIYQADLYTGINLLNFVADYITVSNTTKENSYDLDGENLLSTGFNFSTSYTKALRKQEIQPSFGHSFSFLYKDLKLAGDNENQSYLGSYNSSIYLPGIVKSNGTKISMTSEYRPEDETAYKMQNKYSPILNYTFSRGYSYRYTPKFTKYSLEYNFPLAYPNIGFRDWIYIKRLRVNFFHDHTQAQINNENIILNSEGLEFTIDSSTFRKFPLNYGVRIYRTERDNNTNVDLFLSI